eukprot:TRINITY_DN2472_c0_g1_i1.p1 TRINITY_DN2472_c0_g1~~TRINITY_DN2472_c0_g1_i1.p1  ORF type:complete len:664 (+),score=182.94 TRINITY_DN2472_c0_g1_i1:149-2140(+)
MSWVTQKAQQKENRDDDDSDRDSDENRAERPVNSARRSPPASPSREKASTETAAARSSSSAASSSRRIELQRRKEQRQQNVENLLNQITERSNEIVTEVMSWKVGADEHALEKKDEMLRLARKREWLRSQLQFYQSYLEADLAPISIDENMSVDAAVEREKELYAEIQQLQDKAFEANNNLLQQQLLLRRVLEQPVLYKVVFPDGKEDGNAVDELLRKLFVERDRKVEALLKLHEELTALHDERFEIQKKMTELKISNRAKWKQYKQKKHVWESHAQTNAPPVSESAQTDPEIRALENKIAEKWKFNTIIRRVTQAIIIGGGVNWAKDKNTRDFLLTLEEPPNIAAASDEIDPEELREEELLKEYEREIEQEERMVQQQPRSSTGTTISFRRSIIKKPQTPNGHTEPHAAQPVVQQHPAAPVASPRPPPTRRVRSQTDDDDEVEEVIEDDEPVAEDDWGEYQPPPRPKKTAASPSADKPPRGRPSSAPRRRRGQTVKNRPVENLADPIIIRFRQLDPSWTHRQHTIRQRRVATVRKDLAAAGYDMQNLDPNTLPESLFRRPEWVSTWNSRPRRDTSLLSAAPAASSSADEQYEDDGEVDGDIYDAPGADAYDDGDVMEVDSSPAVTEMSQPRQPLVTEYVPLPRHDDDLDEMDDDINPEELIE